MISLSKAQQLILRHTSLLPVVQKDFQDVLGHTLAQHVVATTDWPPFSRSTMDGFAVKSADIKNVKAKRPIALTMIGESRAGHPFLKTMGAGQAVKISTGAILPRGADSVVVKEEANIINNSVVVERRVLKGENVRFQGQDATKGTVLIEKGTEANPGVVALLANLGQRKVKVFKTPSVGIITTGDELVGFKKKVRLGQIRSANEYGLAAQIKQLHAEPFILGKARDSLESIIRKIRQGLVYDVLLISGGVSVGDHDFVRQALRKMNVREIFWKVAVKPGKPLLFARKGKCHIFGLPGNTVSSMVSLLTFVRPCLRKMSGCKDCFSQTAEAVLTHNICDYDKRAKIMRGVIFENKGRRFVGLSGHQVSENIISMAKANCLLTMDEKATLLKKGSHVIVEYI